MEIITERFELAIALSSVAFDRRCNSYHDSNPTRPRRPPSRCSALERHHGGRDSARWTVVTAPWLGAGPFACVCEYGAHPSLQSKTTVVLEDVHKTRRRCKQGRMVRLKSSPRQVAMGCSNKTELDSNSRQTKICYMYSYVPLYVNCNRTVTSLFVLSSFFLFSLSTCEWSSLLTIFFILYVLFLFLLFFSIDDSPSS